MGLDLLVLERIIYNGKKDGPYKVINFLYMMQKIIKANKIMCSNSGDYSEWGTTQPYALVKYDGIDQKYHKGYPDSWEGNLDNRNDVEITIYAFSETNLNKSEKDIKDLVSAFGDWEEDANKRERI